MRQRLHARNRPGVYLYTDIYGLTKHKKLPDPRASSPVLVYFFFVCIFFGGDVDYSVVTDCARLRSNGVVKQQ
jgi:hypothetical protein